MSTIWRLIIVFKLFGISVVSLTPEEVEAQRSGWNVNPNTQYHIQTDEGPERYFRYQTLNGQFRKEKRLEDGTVIGTEGWMDLLGFLRIKDYIADREGFRILRSKTIYVGKHRPVENAAAATKSALAQTGRLVEPKSPQNRFRQSLAHEFHGNNIESNLIKPHVRNPLSSDSFKKYIASSTRHLYPRSNYYSTTTPNSHPDVIATSINNNMEPKSRLKMPYKQSYQKSHPYADKPAIEVKLSRHNGEQIDYDKQQSIQIEHDLNFGIY